MGRNRKDARANLRELSSKEEAMFQNMMSDLKKLEAELRTSIEERSLNIEATLLDLASARDAINAGLNSARKELEKLNRKLGKSKVSQKAPQAIREVARELGDVRNTYVSFRKRVENYKTGKCFFQRQI